MIRMIALVVLALGTRAYADRTAADQLAAEAKLDPSKLDACGRAYLDVYNQDLDAPDNDEILAAGAACFHAAHSISAEIQTYTVLIRYYPHSKRTPAALRASAVAYANVAYFDRSAALFEDYAMKYAGEPDADQALTEAIALRAALGDRARQIEDTLRFTRMFGAKRRDAAAAGELVLADVVAPDDAIAHLRKFVSQFAHVDPELVGLGHARLGELLWARSCPVRALDGLCVKLARPRSESCDPEVVKLEAVARTGDARLALAEERLAIESLATAVPSARGRHAVAMARLALADAELEKLIARPFPSELDFTPDPARRATRERSRRALTAWLDGQTELASAISQQYTQVLELKDPEASVAASARLGQTVEALWRALVVSPRSRDVLHGDFVAAKRVEDCAAMHEIASPLADRASELFRSCMTKSAELGAGVAWADLCERGGNAIRPNLFPIGHELVGPPLPGPASIAIESPPR